MTSGGWKGSDRKSRLPSNWVGLTGIVRQRAGGRCEMTEPFKEGGLVKRCWRRGRDVDHIVAGDDHSLQNLQLLCPYHHGKKSAMEGVEARKKAPAKRDPEAHPGSKA